MSTDQDFTTQTAGWDARTTRPEHTHRQPSRTALATRSLTAVERLPMGSPERAEAFAQHFEEFAPGRTCRVAR